MASTSPSIDVGPRIGASSRDPGRNPTHISSIGKSSIAGIARQAAPFGTLDRRATERLAKTLVVELKDRLQVEPRAEPWLELWPATRAAARRRVVRTYLLANVAAENPLAELWPQVGADRPTVLDRQVGDAAFGRQVVGLIQRIGWTGVNAQAAAAAVFRHGLIEVQIDGQGRMVDYSVLQGQMTSDVGNFLLFTTYTPATLFLQPASSRIVIRRSRIVVKG